MVSSPLRAQIFPESDDDDDDDAYDDVDDDNDDGDGAHVQPLSSLVGREELQRLSVRPSELANMGLPRGGAILGRKPVPQAGGHFHTIDAVTCMIGKPPGWEATIRVQDLVLVKRSKPPVNNEHFRVVDILSVPKGAHALVKVKFPRVGITFVCSTSEGKIEARTLCAASMIHAVTDGDVKWNDARATTADAEGKVWVEATARTLLKEIQRDKVKQEGKRVKKREKKMKEEKSDQKETEDSEGIEEKVEDGFDGEDEEDDDDDDDDDDPPPANTKKTALGTEKGFEKQAEEGPKEEPPAKTTAGGGEHEKDLGKRGSGKKKKNKKKRRSGKKRKKKNRKEASSEDSDSSSSTEKGLERSVKGYKKAKKTLRKSNRDKKTRQRRRKSAIATDDARRKLERPQSESESSSSPSSTSSSTSSSSSASSERDKKTAKQVERILARKARKRKRDYEAPLESKRSDYRKRRDAEVRSAGSQRRERELQNYIAISENNSANALLKFALLNNH
jgi:hypothetical protein